MRSTGIIRRIDDLGRVVIPMDIRKLMRLKPGDEFELIPLEGGGVILQKYDSSNEEE